jgi:DNA-binding transcriptional ArsR family regulator
MDSLITAAARALSSGDPLGALNRIALRDDPPALALRGTAMAQLGDLDRARLLLRRAARGFGPKEAVARARCVVAEAEIALALRELSWPAAALSAAQATLERHGDGVNAAYARHLEVRRLLLIGRLDEAEGKLAQLDPALLPPATRTLHELVAAGLALRRLRSKAARAALARAAQAAGGARIPALLAEVDTMRRALDAPQARIIKRGLARPVLVEEVEALQDSKALIIDACRYVVRDARHRVALATRPVLFALARALGEAWPQDVTREALLAAAFRTKAVHKQADETHRARLRVEIGRLRAKLKPLADISATRDGFVLVPRGKREAVVLAQPRDEDHTEMLALLADGESWSSSALALALDVSQRTVQRALDELAEAGRVQSFGRGRGRRWIVPPAPGFTTALLLPAALASE